MYGMGLGIILTTGHFVYHYVQASESVISEIGCGGTMYKSTVHRTMMETKILKVLGEERIIVAKIQGYLFFGNTSVIQKQLKTFLVQKFSGDDGGGGGGGGGDSGNEVFLILNMEQVCICTL